MNKDKKFSILIILIVTLSLVGIGIAFAAFSQTLTINGSAEVEAASWKVVFEGMTNVNSLDAPTTTGTASEVTHPTIKNNSTEISTYSVSLKTPGDSITYNFKIHNKGDFAANLSSLTIAGINRPSFPVSGASLVTDSSIATANAKTLAKIEYKLYYTTDNSLVGQNAARDCLEAGESANVSLRITFSVTSETDTEVLPSTDLVLNNLGITAVYNQTSNGVCPLEPGVPVVNVPFENVDYSYYSYGGKSFIGTGVNNVVISENIIGKSQWSSARSTECSDGTLPTGSNDYNKRCQGAATLVFVDSPAADAAAAYCEGCRLMTLEELCDWVGEQGTTCKNTRFSKIIGKYDSTLAWWLNDASSIAAAWSVGANGRLYNTGYADVTLLLGVRPVTDIPSTATMSGSGTKLDPYLIQ